MKYAIELPLVVAATLFGVTLGPSEDVEQRLARAAEHAAGDDLGLAVTIVVGGEELYADAWNRDPSGEPAAVTQAFPAPELTPLLIALRAGAAVSAGELDSERPFVTFFTEEEVAPLVGTDYADVELGQLLAHTSGFVEWTEDGPWNARDYFTWLADEPLEHDPGSCYQPREQNRLLVACALERSSGTTLADWFTQAVIEELDLKNTELSAADQEPRAREASGDRDDADEAFTLPVFETSARDLARLFDAAARERVLPGALELATAEVRLTEGDLSPASWEFVQGSVAEHTSVRGSGSGRGSSFVVAHYPEIELTIAVVAADEDTDATASIERTLARAFFGIPEPGRASEVLEPEELEQFRGGYYIGCTRISIEPRDERSLYAIWPEGREIELCYRGYDTFEDCDDHEVQLAFQRDETSNRPIAFALDDHGWQTTAMRLD